MIFLLCLIPFTISLLTGWLLVNWIDREERRLDVFLQFFLSFGIGLAINAHLTFLSFILADRMNKPLAWGLSIAVMVLLAGLNIWSRRRRPAAFFSFKDFDLKSLGALLALVIASIPLWQQSTFYPLGGWDAWSTWNLKSKIMFLGGEHWKAVFSPFLWRSSPHYPLLLPFINVWGLTPFQAAVYQVPFLTGILYTLLTMGLLFSVTRRWTGPAIATAAPVLLLTNLFFTKLAGSQYSDIIFGFYLLAAIICLMMAFTHGSRSCAILAGACVGILSFTKAEGLVAAALLIMLAVPYLLWLKDRSTGEKGSALLLKFLINCAIFGLPSVLFAKIYSPGNQTFANGLASDHATLIYRLKVILMFYAIELISVKWKGLWILSLGGLLLSWGKCFRKELLVIPVFLTGYLGIVSAYYLINTRWEIAWFLQVSLHRILFSLLPIALFWVFYSLWQNNRSKN